MSITEERIFALEHNLICSRANSEEILWANIFHDTIIGSRWFHNQPLSPGRAAIGYPALYALYRVLDEFQPQNILEMGLGQSTKMISSYVKWRACQQAECRHVVVEHDQSWIDFFKKQNEVSDHTQIVRLDLIQASIETEKGDTTPVNLYKGFSEKFKNEKFDLIFIDGPFGSPLYSRIDILDLLPECLADSFVIMLDDAQRTGEMNTIKMIIQAIVEGKCAVSAGYYSGQKSTAVITSKDLHFLCTM